MNIKEQKIYHENKIQALEQELKKHKEQLYKFELVERKCEEVLNIFSTVKIMLEKGDITPGEVCMEALTSTDEAPYGKVIGRKIIICLPGDFEL